MKWASLADFLHMGGYGLYVWGSYFVATVLIVIEIVVLAARHKAALRRTATPLPERETH